MMSRWFNLERLRLVLALTALFLVLAATIPAVTTIVLTSNAPAPIMHVALAADHATTDASAKTWEEWWSMVQDWLMYHGLWS